MNPIHPLRRVLAALTALGCALLAFTATGPAAFAMIVPDPGGGGADSAPTPGGVRVLTGGGMPGWQITLIAAAAALVAATAAVLIDRALAARRVPATSA
jgi:hypothetical protein